MINASFAGLEGLCSFRLNLAEEQSWERDEGFCQRKNLLGMGLLHTSRIVRGPHLARLVVPRMHTSSIGYPVRKSIQQDLLGTQFPQLCREDPEMPVSGSPWGRRQPCRKVLPDRSRAARDRANQKLVEYIVKARGAESHLRAILKNRKPSRWLKTFLNSGQYVTCVETYLEDEEQLDLVVKYLQGVYQEAGSRMLTQINCDRIRFILDVLLPEVSGQQGILCVRGLGVCGTGPTIELAHLCPGMGCTRHGAWAVWCWDITLPKSAWSFLHHGDPALTRSLHGQSHRARVF